MDHRFIEIPNAKLIFELAEWCVEACRPVLITGPAGTGKSTALSAFVERNGSGRLVTASPANKSLRNMLTTICEVFGYPNYHRNTKDIEDILLHQMPYAVERGEFLVVDECQVLGGDTLRQILVFWDLCNLPVIFAGNQHALKRSRATAAAFDQIETRIARRIMINGVTEADIRAFCVEFNVEGAEAYRLMARYGINRSLRDTVNLLSQARRIAGPRGSLNKTHIAEALVDFCGPQAAGRLIQSRAA